jgi:hypothetical protein
MPVLIRRSKDADREREREQNRVLLRGMVHCSLGEWELGGGRSGTFHARGMKRNMDRGRERRRKLLSLVQS